MAGTDWLTLAVFILAFDDPECLRLMHQKAGELPRREPRPTPKLRRIPAGRFDENGKLK